VNQRAVGPDVREPEVDSLIRQLISSVDTEDIVVYDVSDCQLFGRKHYRRLTGELAQAAEVAGCRPEVYQSVYWWTLVYFPVKPVGTYLVMPRQECDDPDGDADQYRAVKLPMDWDQVRREYLIAFSVAFALIFGVICAVVVWQAAR
jgi:hypothetical protein